MANASKVGDRLGEPPAPELVEHVYTPGPSDNHAGQFTLMSAINKAHVLMLQRQRILTDEVARQLLEAILQVEEAGYEGLDFDPTREDLYFNYEHAVVEHTSAAIGGQMHTGRSRNDLGATMVRMRSRGIILSLVEKLVELRSTLLDKAAEYQDVVFPGYTHLQPAQPVTLGHYFTAVEEGLSRDTTRMLAAYDTANASSLGAAASAGTGFPIDRDLPAKWLGFTKLARNTLDAVASRDYLLETLSAATIAAGTLNRHVQDLYVWYTQEFGLIDFRDRVSGTSSIMPQKKNPVLLENIKGRTSHQLGAFTAAIAGIRNSHYQNIIDANRIGFNPSWQALEELRVSLLLTRVAVENIIINKDRALERCKRDFSTVTQLADTLVITAGISFREAHEIVGGTVRRAIDSGKDATEITINHVREAAQEVLGRELPLNQDTLTRALDPEFGIGVRGHAGGPAPTSVAKMIASAQERLATDKQAITETHAALQTAADQLNQEVKAFLDS